jgi:hypothetical protein
MRRKVSTIMDASLFQRAKLEAAHRGKPLSAIIQEALNRYLAGPAAAGQRHMTVAESWGAMAVPPEVFREIMESDEDDFYA